jgi:hypothetical protein
MPVGIGAGGMERRGPCYSACTSLTAYIPKERQQCAPCPKHPTRLKLICRCGARMKLARQLPWLDHRLPAILLFQCTDCGHVDMVEWPESEGEEAP